MRCHTVFHSTVTFYNMTTTCWLDHRPYGRIGCRVNARLMSTSYTVNEFTASPTENFNELPEKTARRITESTGNEAITANPGEFVVTWVIYICGKQKIGNHSSTLSTDWSPNSLVWRPTSVAEVEV